jgi:RNA polymerase sigma-70 factor (ECF subfamily)
MERIAAGDRRAMSLLYARHSTRIYRFVLRFIAGDPGLAEDIVSEAFLEVWKQASRFEGRAQASTWMLSIARHRALSALRKPRHDQLDDAMAANIPDDFDNADVMLQKQRRANVLRESLSALSPSHREIIDLVYYHGMSIAQVAEVTRVPQSTVKTRMFYARKRLAALLDAKGLDAAA